MANLTVKHTYYERYVPSMSFDIEVNGNSYNIGNHQGYSVLEGVEEGLNRLLRSLSLAGIEGEAVMVTGATLNAGTQQYLVDKYTNNKEVASLAFA